MRLIRMVRFLLDHWGDLASVAGLVVAYFAFLRARGAEQAALETRARISQLSTVEDLAAVCVVMKEILRLQTAGAWDIALERYHTVRERLVAIHAANPRLPAEERTDLQFAIQHLRRLQSGIERSLQAEVALDTAELNRTAAQQVDRIVAVLAKVRSRAGE